MDNISVDPVLHEKIIQKVTQKQKPARVMKYALIAACMAILALGIWAIPYYFNNMSNNSNVLQGTIPGYTLPGDPEERGGETMPTPLPSSLHALTFNTAESAMPSRIRFPDGYFYYSLTSEQLAAVFPSLYLNLSAIVQYRADGSVLYVTASEYAQVGARRHFTGVQISVGKEGAPLGGTFLLYDSSPIVSEIHDVQVTAFAYGWENSLFRAEFVLNDMAYLVQTRDSIDSINGYEERTGQQKLTEIVNLLILNGMADLSVLDNPIIPELRNDVLTLADARRDSQFGAFLPSSVPHGFTFETAIRHISTSDNSLFASWSNGLNNISWFARTPLESDLWNIVSISDKYKYDVSLYTMPWAFSVPAEIHYYFQSPVFLAEEFTIDAIYARTLMVDSRTRPGAEATANWQTSQFGILFDDVIVIISAHGLSPQEIWEMLRIRY